VTVDLHPDCKARITELVSKALPLLDVLHGKFVKRSSEGIVFLFLADQALPQRGPLHDTLLAYVDDYPFVEFVLDTLAAELRSAKYEEAPVQKLTTVSGYEDADAVAARLVSKFAALPNRYRLTFPLPKALWSCLPAKENRWTLETASSRLIRTSKELSESLPLAASSEEERIELSGGSLLSSLLDTSHLSWEEGAVHLQIDVEGFIGPYGGSVPDLESRRFIRSFCGLGLALQLFQTNSNYALYPPRHSYFVHRKAAEGNWQVERRLELDDSVSRGLERLQLAELVSTPEKQQHWCPRILEEMAHVVSAGKRSELIMLASQWYFDSATGSDRLLPFIQAMVVLEILLGDKAASKEIGLNELLRNRCAYLIGSSQEERAELHKAFGDIYDVRSQIVHRGKHRLNVHEQSLLGRLRSMCRRVIQKEVDLLVVDKKKKEAAEKSPT
jgi:Apea-like HEPN